MKTTVKMKRWICGDRQSHKNYIRNVIEGHSWRLKGYMGNDPECKPVRATITVTIETEEKGGKNVTGTARIRRW